MQLNTNGDEAMPMTTNSLVAKTRKLAVPAGILATVLFAAAFLFDYGRAHAAAAAAGPLDENSVSSLVALDNAVEAVASRVTPAVVNVAVTSRVSEDEQDSDQNSGQGPGDGGHNFGGVNPQDLPPGFRQFFFGPGGQQMKPQPQFEHGVGSGVILTADGYIVTNDHVVDGATQIRVTLNDRRIFTAKLIGEDKLNDLAVIKIDAHDLTSVPWGDSAKVKPGETVLAFGNPFGNFPFTVTRGIISGLDRPNPYRDDPRKPGAFIQTDAAINPGNSGGPLVNAYGEVIGINTFIISGSGSFAGAGFAIPSQIAESTAQAIIKNGSVHHGYLGISMNDVTPENAGFFTLPDAAGAIVSQVTPDSPAGRAGLVSGDVLREIDGKKIPNGGMLQVAVSEMSPGTAIELGILRDGKAQTLHVTVGEFHKDSSEAASNDGPGAEQKGRLGLAVANLTPDLRQQFNVPDRVKGAVIQAVRPGSAAEDAGLTAGDVILGVDRHPVEDADSFVNQLHSEPAGKDVLLLVWANGGESYLVLHPDENQQNGE
jgi:serine protease Do